MHTVGLFLSLDGARWSAAPVPFTFYAANSPPIVRNISLAFGALDAGPTLLVSGANFAPTQRGALSCLFTPVADAGAAAPRAPPVRAPATFVSIAQVRCAAPPRSLINN